MERMVKVQINEDLFKQLCKLGYTGLTVEELLEKLVSHCNICDTYWNEERER